MKGTGKGNSRNLSEQYVSIEIFGQPYTFKAEVDIDSAQAVADFLSREIHKVEVEVMKSQPGVNKKAILILAALNIANAHFETRRNYSDFLRSVSDRSASLLQILDTAVR